MEGPSRVRGLWRGVAVLAVAMLAIGAFVAGPASAGRFLTKRKALKLFYTKSQADAKFLTQGQANNAFLGQLVTVVNKQSVTGGTAYTDFSVDCPAGFTATGGGVAPTDDDIKIVRSSPAINGTPVANNEDGQYGAPNGWFARVQNNDAGVQFAVVVAVCAQ
jgi:hypothetical protein